MKYSQLGQSDLQISLIGLGTMTWGLQNDQKQGFEQMDYAVESGINFFDTAEIYAIPPSEATYGTTESIIGNWFSKRKKRQDIILATKIAGPGLSWVRNGKNHIDKNTILLAVEASLKRLQTDYIDLYQLHWPNRGSYHFGQIWNYSPKFDASKEKDNFLEVLHTLQSLVQVGKIRHFGLSNETAWGLANWLQLSEKFNLPRAVSIQNEYSLLCRHFEPDLSEISLHENCGLLAWSPLCRGMISGKYLNGARPEGARITIETRAEHRTHPKTDEAITKYLQLAKENDLDVCQMAIAFVNEQPFVNSTLIGATTMTQLKNNIDAIELSLTKEVKQKIEKIRRENPMPF